MAFSSQGFGQSICSKERLALGAIPSRKTCHPEHVQLKRLQGLLKVDASTKNKTYGQRLVISSMSNSTDRLSPLSPSATIEQFYICINEKNSMQLGKFIGENCLFEDLTFPYPFRGKTEVLQFFNQLITCLGKNIQFNLGHVCERDDHRTAAVNWHLEWKKKQIPLTRGCSYFELSREGERLVIRKAQVLVEFPIKLGFLAPNLLKFVTSLFDAYPEATEGFLRSHQFILQVLLKIYSIVLVPWISPLLAFYINVWTVMTFLLNFTLQIFHYISKIFFK